MCLIILKKYVLRISQNSTCENQAILLVITDGKKWHYLAVTRLSALRRGIASKHNGDFYCLNCFSRVYYKK